MPNTFQEKRWYSISQQAVGRQVMLPDLVDRPLGVRGMVQDAKG